MFPDTRCNTLDLYNIIYYISGVLILKSYHGDGQKKSGNFTTIVCLILNVSLSQTTKLLESSHCCFRYALLPIKETLSVCYSSSDLLFCCFFSTIIFLITKKTQRLKPAIISEGTNIFTNNGHDNTQFLINSSNL